MIDTPANAVMPVAPLRVLLRRVIDYAGLFPPASLDMSGAITEYAQHRTGPDTWALGRFVLPAARLDEFESASSGEIPREAAHSWALSALAGSDVEEDIGRIESFNQRHRDARMGAVIVDTVELKANTARDVARAGELLDRRFDTYIEIPVAEDPAHLIAAIADTHAKAKIRMGGVTGDAFPASAVVVRFMARCVAHDVAFKATAGLHHPVRAEYRLTYAPDAPRGMMYGFLNVLLALAGLHEGWQEAEVGALLDERETNAISFDETGARWRDRRLGITALSCARESMPAFGSCSFREPLTDLRSLGLL